MQAGGQCADRRSGDLSAAVAGEAERPEAHVARTAAATAARRRRFIPAYRLATPQRHASGG